MTTAVKLVKVIIQRIQDNWSDKVSFRLVAYDEVRNCGVMESSSILALLNSAGPLGEQLRPTLENIPESPGTYIIFNEVLSLGQDQLSVLGLLPK